jgi:putative transcriptional regulator
LTFSRLELDKHIALKNFGQHIRQVRKSKGLTQIEVASAMRRDQQSLQRVESGRVNPSLTYLIELAMALNVSFAELGDFSHTSENPG